MLESLYSNSIYLEIITFITMVLSMFFPVLLRKKLNTHHTPKILRRFILICFTWSACNLIGSIFFSGPIEPGSTDFLIRQIVFGIQSIAWIQIGVQALYLGDLVSTRKVNGILGSFQIVGIILVISQTILLIIAPNAIADFSIFDYKPFAEHTITYSSTVLFILFNSPFLLITSYVLLRSAMNRTYNKFTSTSIFVAAIFSTIIVLAFFFDIIIPIFMNDLTGLKDNHFLLFHQYFIVMLTVMCGQYYTSTNVRNKGAYWFLNKLISKMEDGIIYFDDFGKIDFVNSGACNLLGMKAEDIRGKSIRSIFPSNLDFFREVIYNNIKMNINGETHSFKIHFFKSRQTLTTVINIAYFTDLSKTMLLQQNLKTLNAQYVEYTHDLVRYQDRLNKEASIKAEKENVLNTLINALPFRVWYKSEKGVYQKQNQLDLDRQGSQEGIIDPPDKVTSFENKARTTGEVGTYTAYENKDGEEISLDEANKLTREGEPVSTFDIMYIPIVQGKPPFKTLCIMVDITKQRRLEQERNMRREQKFIHSRLEELGTMCGAFAHDYNNILGSQIGFCQLAQEMLPKDNQAYMFISEALKAAERGKTSLNELLNTIRGKANSATPAIVFAPYMIIEDVVKKVSLTLPPSITIHSEDMDKNLRISGIVASLDRIISNLANNAIFAMKETGGTLTFRLEPATLEEQLMMPYVPPIPPGNYAKIAVTDTGTGMDSSTLERIFAPFFTTKAPGEGLGLGLSSAFRLLKEANAYLTVQTTLGKGTTFELYWPLVIENKEDSCPQS